ncbi:acriflavin resistance protein [Elizabethkingia anophelis]|nr:acriflavin resistance protein [Elizabethkingia anophelis]MDV3601327.1 acriflavin resistance protein [Elizabethkingia anophelis]MDV3608608.1 acriflavin resistance protein [Elizabethkingia anophelis]MDV3640596.1 acriflavin resistance protein [Elizabethkingia anophelis]MDV3651326.1 acriflavin resistance protein [Elizabethkingia anophelis]
MSLTELSIRRPLLICTIFVCLILFGVIGYSNLKYNLLPDFSTGTISIQSRLLGASASEIEEKVTKPIEDAISTVEGVDMVTSSSMQNASLIQVSLKPGVSDVIAQQDIERKINQISSNLPEDMNEPVINRVSTDNISILNLSVSAKVSASELYDVIDKDIKPKLSSVNGVGQISIIGGEPRVVKVLVNNRKLRSYGLSSKQVYQNVFGNTSSVPAGNISGNGEFMNISIDGDYRSIESLSKVVLFDSGNGSRVLLGDVAEISYGNSRVETLNRVNHKSGIGIQIFKTNDANAVDVSKLVKEKLKELELIYKSKGLSYTIASDQSVYTLSSADAVMHDLMIAIIIVGFVMMFFLHSFRSSLFVLVSIPSAIIPTFIVMYLMGFSLNLMTLLALSLVVGILVDDSIVVLENIFRHLEMGKPREVAALDGRNEIGFTALAITLVDVVVFLPMAFATGLIGNILREFSVVVVVSTLMSLLVAFTLTPIMASRFAKLEVINRESLWGRVILRFESFIDYLKDVYADLLLWFLSHKRYLFIGIMILMLCSLALLPMGFIGSSFTGTSDRGELSIRLESSSNTPIKDMNLLVERAESMLLKHPEVVNVYTLVGSQTGAKGNSENLAELSVSLNSKTDRSLTTDEFGVMIRGEIEKIPGLEVSVIPTGITGNVQAPIQIVVRGSDAALVEKSAQEVKAYLMDIPGSDYVRYSTKHPSRQILVTPDREKISMLGLNFSDVSQSIQLAFNGNDKLDFLQGDESLPLDFVFDDEYKKDIEGIENLSISNAKGGSVGLAQVADIREVLAPTILERTDREKSITITASAVGVASGTIIKSIQSKLKDHPLPRGIDIYYNGDAKNQSEAFGSLVFVLVIAIVLVYMIMVSLYESLVYPFVVIFSVPVALIGALLGIALTMNQLTIFTIIGMIMLLGLVTKNGILIVDFANHLKKEGYSLTQALVEAGKERLRPIIMTTFAMILGMLPLALSQSPGSEFKNGMAWVLIGGLTSSFLLTLFVVPSVYYVLESWLLKSKSKQQQQQQQQKQ